MRVLGIDLATEPRKTGAIFLESTESGLPVASLGPRVLHDDALVAAASTADVVSIACPLGWPLPFIAAVSAHARFSSWASGDDRSELLYRETDLIVRNLPGGSALSVSADRLGATAMRCALLQDRFSREIWGGELQHRDGSGRLVEAYPRMALAHWDLPATGYKGAEGKDARHVIISALESMIDLDAVRAECITNDNSLDALICGYVGFLAKTNHTARPTPDQLDRSRVEGWIHIPC